MATIGIAWADGAWNVDAWASGAWATEAAPATEPRGSTPRHPRHDFGEHYPFLSKSDKDRIDHIIAELTPQQEQRLKSGRPSKAVRRKIAQVLPEYREYKPRPQADYLAMAQNDQARILRDRTDDLMREDEEAIVAILLLAS